MNRRSSLVIRRRRLVLVESLRKYAAGLPTTAPTDVAALGVSGGTPAACPAWCELTSPHLDELHAATLGKDAHVQVFLVAPEDGGGPVEVDLYVAGNAVEVVSPFMLTPDELETMSATLRAAAAKLRRLQDRPL